MVLILSSHVTRSPDSWPELFDQNGRLSHCQAFKVLTSGQDDDDDDDDDEKYQE
jgi:hypothetical protein